MRRALFLTTLVAAVLILVLPGQARATDGHFLHGVGAVNSSMGGAAMACPVDILGAAYVNPAGLMKFDGTRIALGFEGFKPDRTLSSSLTVPVGGGQFATLAGETRSTSEWTPIPAFGFTTKVSDNVVLGFTGIGIGGFGVDYAASAIVPPGVPANPILAPRPNGFGQVFSNFQLMKLAPAVAFSLAEDKLWIGVAANIDWAGLAIDPMPAAAPAVSMGPGGMPQSFYSRATAMATQFGFGFQIGAIYNINDMVSIGASYTSKQDFADFEWNSMWENPGIRTGPMAFGTPRRISFGLDVPAVLGGGIGVQALPNLLVAVDFKRIYYASTDGFSLEDPTRPFNPDGSVAGFGWQDINVWALGAQFKPSDSLALRVGYNRSDNPVPDSLSMINVAAPAIVQNHYTLGLGWAFDRKAAVNLGYYHVSNNSISGPIYGPFGPIPGSDVTTSMKEDSLLLSFSFATRGDVF
jgi:long-chain fatty acid transport protein